MIVKTIKIYYLFIKFLQFSLSQYLGIYLVERIVFFVVAEMVSLSYFVRAYASGQFVCYFPFYVMPIYRLLLSMKRQHFQQYFIYFIIVVSKKKNIPYLISQDLKGRVALSLKGISIPPILTFATNSPKFLPLLPSHSSMKTNETISIAIFPRYCDRNQ